MNVSDFSVSDENSEYFRVAWGLSKFLLFEITREKEYFTLSSVGINNQQFMRALARAARTKTDNDNSVRDFLRNERCLSFSPFFLFRSFIYETTLRAYLYFPISSRYRMKYVNF